MKVYLCVDKDGTEHLSTSVELQREYSFQFWHVVEGYTMINLPKGYIETLLGKPLTWDDAPVEVQMQLTVNV